MSRTSSLLTYINAIAGRLPPGAITEWLESAAPASVTIEEDSCGNIVGEPMGLERFRRDTPSVVRTRTVHSAYGDRITNWQWCQMEMVRHNLKFPHDPVSIHVSRKTQAYICLVKVKSQKDNAQ